MSTAVTNQVIDVNLIKPHPFNYNQHSPAHIADLRASLKEFEQVKSIVVQADTTGGYICVAGHGILEAAQPSGDWPGVAQLRSDVIPADWPQVKVLAYLAADNELGRYSDPDLEQLAQLTHTIGQTDVDLARLAAGSDVALRDLTSLYDAAEQRRIAEARAEEAARFLDTGDDEHDAGDDLDDEQPHVVAHVTTEATAPDNPYVNLVFVADRVQRDFVMQTLAHVRDVYNLETSVDAIVKLCEFFEAGTDGTQETTS